MADVFISYGRPDRPFIDKLAEVLRGAGLSVWFDRSLTVGEEFSKEIEQEARAAGCCVVVWSKTSVSRPWVKAEAQLGRQLDKLVPVMIEDCDLPLPFNGLHTVKLPATGDIDPASPAIEAIRKRAAQAIAAVRAKRREPRIGQDLVRQLLIERAQLDPDAPGDFIEAHEIEFEGLRFYPLMVGNLAWRGQVSASIGYDRDEEYEEEVQQPAPDGKGTVAVRQKRTRKVTDWKPHAAPMSGVVEIGLPAIDTGGPINEALVTFSHHEAFALDELPEGAEIEPAEKNPLGLAGNRPLIESEIRGRAEAALPGDRKKDVKVSETLDASDMRLVYLPVWSATVSYGGRSIPLAASAMDGGETIFDMPKDAGLIADRARRSRAATGAFGNGLLAAVAGGAGLSGVQLPKWGLPALAALGLYAALRLAFWPSLDKARARAIFERESRSAEQRGRAAAAAGVEATAPAPVDRSATRTVHVLAWLAALAAAAASAYLGLRGYRAFLAP